MTIRLARSVLMIGVTLALMTPAARAPAQTKETNVSAPSASPNVGATKHRYWRHRGGTHPHYGSHRLRKPAS